MFGRYTVFEWLAAVPATTTTSQVPVGSLSGGLFLSTVTEPVIPESGHQVVVPTARKLPTAAGSGPLHWPAPLAVM